MEVVTAAQMREIDRRAIEELGIPGPVLMENAALRVVETIEQRVGKLCDQHVVVVCGKGNNGGDGLAIARFLKNAGARVAVFLVARGDELRGDARINYEILTQSGTQVREIEDTLSLESALGSATLVVDALLGTGISGEVKGLQSEIIELINRASARRREACCVVAVDIPSGLNADDGKVAGCCVRADWTVTFGLPKLGLLLHPGAEYAGELWVGEIGIPQSLIEPLGIRTRIVTVQCLQEWLSARRADSHKGDYGKLLIVGGSAGLTGAAVLAGQAAMRAGAGLVTVGIPKSLNAIVKSHLIEAMSLPLPETDEQSLSLAALEPIQDFLKGVDVLAIGPGLSRHPETQQLVRKLLESSSLPAVVDADGLAAITEDPSSVLDRGFPTILTPHPGEMAHMLGWDTNKVNQDRVAAVRQAVEKFQCVVVLKGARTLIAGPEGEFYVNLTGNPGMASGGTGDVLTGILVALLGQGCSALESAAAGVFLHGLAGDIAAQEVGEMSLIASDLIAHLPRAVRQTLECREAGLRRLLRLI